jgi:hypothetical protein
MGSCGTELNKHNSNAFVNKYWNIVFSLQDARGMVKEMATCLSMGPIEFTNVWTLNAFYLYLMYCHLPHISHYFYDDQVLQKLQL